MSFLPNPAPAGPKSVGLGLRRRIGGLGRDNRRCLASVAASANAVSSFDQSEIVPVNELSIVGIPDETGVYAMLDDSQTVRYIGITRKIASCVEMHAREVSDKAKFVKFAVVSQDATKEDLQGIWKDWMQSAIETTGGIPDGNAKGNTDWALKKKAVKPDLKLTPGKGLDQLNLSLDQLLQNAVNDFKVVAFVKGTREAPQCGFSHTVMTELSRQGVEFEVVNVLDEVYNPGVREKIKEMSDWPTIPQVYVNGEFVGGCDIVMEMAANGQLKDVLTA